jgi:hypothetical protein
MYTRRCRACWFKAHVGLPPLSRKVVYIDQFAISDMMKTLNAEHPEPCSRRKASARWCGTRFTSAGSRARTMACQPAAISRP